jgi:Tfp pilus assembly protein PilF
MPLTDAPAENSVAPANRKPLQIAAICAVLAVVTLFAFRGVWNNDFVNYDDKDYVLENSQIQQGLTPQTIAWAFTSDYAGNWHPLTWISHMIDWKLYGNNPRGHHMTNVALHAANAILLFLLLFYMTGFTGRSAMVAFLFALHPAHVESVAWVAERKDLLCAFFFLCALLAYAWYARDPSWKRYSLVVCAFACALMSKPMAVTLPFALLLLDYWPLRRIAFAPEAGANRFASLWKLCIEKWPLFLMAAASSVITLIAQHAGGSVATLRALPLWERLANAVISYCRYVRILFWPNRLRAYYYYDVNHVRVLAAIFSAMALILISAACWRSRKQKPYCLVGWLWFLGTLAPVIGIVQVGKQALAERYTYLPFIGLFIVIVWLAGEAIAKFPKLKNLTQLLAVAILAACIAKTHAQVKVWKNNFTLFNHVLKIDPRGEIPNTNVGMVFVGQGQFPQAEQFFERSLAYDPSWSVTLAYSAVCLMQTHDPRDLPLAGQRLEEALRTDPDDPGILSNLALWYGLSGRPRDEEEYSGMVLAAHPDFVMARLYLGDALQSQNKLDQAAQQYRQALTVVPDNYEAHNSLGNVLDKQGLPDEALKEYRLSLAIEPNQAQAHFKIGRIMTQTHHLPEAVEEFTRALRFDSTKANTHNDLGVALYQLGEYEKAAAEFSSAVQLDPSFADARRNLDAVQPLLKNEKPQRRKP